MGCGVAQCIICYGGVAYLLTSEEPAGHEGGAFYDWGGGHASQCSYANPRVRRDLADSSGRKQCGKITQFAETAM